MVIFLTNLIGSKQRILIIEEPELHLHPHAQRLLVELFREHRVENQLFAITHSPYFIDVDEVENQIVVNMENGNTKVKQLTSQYFSQMEKAKLTKSLSYIDSREMMFSNAVLLVEGDTERSAMTVFADNLGPNIYADKNLSFDKNNVSVIAVGSKNGFEIYMKLLAGFQIPYLVMCDVDAIQEITTHVKLKGKSLDTSSLMAQLARLGLLNDKDKTLLRDYQKEIQPHQTKRGLRRLYKKHVSKELKVIAQMHDCMVLDKDFVGVLKSAGYKGLIEEAKKEVGARSDTRIGRYVAVRIPYDKIPAVFVNIIERAVDKARKRVQSQIAVE